MGIHFGVRNVKKSSHLVACIFRGDLLEFLLEYLKYSNDSETEGDFMFSVSEASVAVITGGSSGIGLNAARALRERGLNVYELSRRAENAEPGVPAMCINFSLSCGFPSLSSKILIRSSPGREPNVKSE